MAAQPQSSPKEPPTHTEGRQWVTSNRKEASHAWQLDTKEQQGTQTNLQRNPEDTLCHHSYPMKPTMIPVQQ